MRLLKFNSHYRLPSIIVLTNANPEGWGIQPIQTMESQLFESFVRYFPQ